MARPNESLRLAAGFSLFGSPFVQRNPVADTAPSDPIGYNAASAKLIPGVESKEISFQFISV
jgi:hypothetical protein